MYNEIVSKNYVTLHLADKNSKTLAPMTAKRMLLLCNDLAFHCNIYQHFTMKI
jgi:hypothetical protein